MDQHWWQKPKGTIAESTFETFRRIRNDQAYRREDLLRHVRLYSNKYIQGLSASLYARENPLPANRLTLNVVQAVVDTAHSLVATNKPKAQFITVGGDYKALRKAEKLTSFVDGQFYQVGLYELDALVCKDAEIAGWGGLLFYEEDDDIKVDRFLPEEIEVEDLEGKYGKPRSLYMHKEVSRAYLMARNPGLKSALESSTLLEDGFSLITSSDMVSVLWAWHLPSRPGANDGRQVICTNNARIFDDKWREDSFPAVIWRWNPDQRGFWAQGLPEQLRGIQVEINSILMKIQRHMKKASSKVFTQKASQVVNRKRNEEWEEISYVGDKPPVFATIQAIAPQYFEQLDRLYRRAFEITGVTQLAAEGLKPSGLDSAKALRAYNDLQTRRFAAIGQGWERFHLDCAKQLIKLAKRISERPEKSYKVKSEIGERLVEIDWKDVALEEDSYRMKVWPAGLLPDTPAGQYQAAQEISMAFPQIQPYALGLLTGIPDLKRIIQRVMAPMNIIEKIIQNILEGEKYIQPQPYMDLQLCLQQMQLAYLEAVAGDVEEEKQGQMRLWMEQAEALIQIATPPAPAQMPGGPQPLPAGPPGMPPGGLPAPEQLAATIP